MILVTSVIASRIIIAAASEYSRPGAARRAALPLAACGQPGEPRSAAVTVTAARWAATHWHPDGSRGAGRADSAGTSQVTVLPPESEAPGPPATVTVTLTTWQVPELVGVSPSQPPATGRLRDSPDHIELFSS